MTDFISPHHKVVFGLSLAVLVLVGTTLWVGFNSRDEVKDAATLNWLTYEDATITFKYPETLGTKYMTALDWPPDAQILGKTFSCNEAGEESDRAGRTERRAINGREFCVTTVVEGAAGSLYSQYAYVTNIKGNSVSFTFSAKSSQCANYDELQKTECEAEKEAFDIDGLIAKVINTFEIKNQNTSVSSFEECEEAGYPITESYPRQCRTLDGRLFVEEIGPVAEVWGSISGSVMLGPTCPVEREPPDPNCGDRPYSGKFNIVKAPSEQIVKTFNSDQQGKFSVEVEAGQYIIRPASVAIFPRCSQSGVIKVEANTDTDVLISCDSGIR
jgi:hypothetical protein